MIKTIQTLETKAEEWFQNLSNNEVRALKDKHPYYKLLTMSDLWERKHVEERMYKYFVLKDKDWMKH